mgnify:FL=1|tara:strand:- start:57 stop:518 length:462 start_codon:yes stop_codon:yes gene_type:complete
MALTKLDVANATEGHQVFKLTSTVNQSLANATEVQLTFNSAPIDTNSITSTANNNVTITASTAGTWLIMAQSRLAERPGRHQLLLQKNDSLILMSEKSSNDAGSGANPTLEMIGILALSSGDVLTLEHYQSSGGSLNTVAGYDAPSIQGVRLF